MGHVKILKKELELISDQYGHFGERMGRIKLIGDKFVNCGES